MHGLGLCRPGIKTCQYGVSETGWDGGLVRYALVLNRGNETVPKSARLSLLSRCMFIVCWRRSTSRRRGPAVAVLRIHRGDCSSLRHVVSVLLDGIRSYGSDRVPCSMGAS